MSSLWHVVTHHVVLSVHHEHVPGLLRCPNQASHSELPGQTSLYTLRWPRFAFNLEGFEPSLQNFQHNVLALLSRKRLAQRRCTVARWPCGLVDIPRPMLRQLRRRHLGGDGNARVGSRQGLDGGQRRVPTRPPRGPPLPRFRRR